jgi:hypothetical protein
MIRSGLLYEPYLGVDSYNRADARGEVVVIYAILGDFEKRKRFLGKPAYTPPSALRKKRILKKNRFFWEFKTFFNIKYKTGPE